jgi:hypothetical protein
MSINGTLVIGEATCDARIVKIADQCNGRIWSAHREIHYWGTEWW